MSPEPFIERDDAASVVWPDGSTSTTGWVGGTARERKALEDAGVFAEAERLMDEDAAGVVRECVTVEELIDNLDKTLKRPTSPGSASPVPVAACSDPERPDAAGEAQNTTQRPDRAALEDLEDAVERFLSEPAEVLAPIVLSEVRAAIHKRMVNLLDEGQAGRSQGLHARCWNRLDELRNVLTIIDLAVEGQVSPTVDVTVTAADGQRVTYEVRRGAAGETSA